MENLFSLHILFIFDFNQVQDISSGIQGYHYSIGGAFLVLILILMFFFFKFKKELKEDLVETRKIAIQDTTAIIPKAKEVQSAKDYISKEKEKAILKNIQDFECKRAFLDKELSLNTLSANIGVNHRYLSYVINKHKEKDFATYINELRVGYIVECLQSKPRYLHYKISYLAEQSGFASHSRFTITFKKVTGYSPSAYISNLKKTKSQEISE